MATPQDALLEQPAPPGGFTGGDANKISPFTPLEGSAPAPRAARASRRRSLPGPRRGRRWSTSYEFEPRGSSCSPTSTTPTPRQAYPGPPGAMAKLVITGGSPPGPMAFFLALGARIPGIPSRGELPGPRTGRGPPPERNPPLSVRRGRPGSRGLPPAVAPRELPPGTGSGVPGPGGRRRRAPLRRGALPPSG